MERDSLLATVGTSLFNNLRNNRPAELPENWSDIQRNFDSRSWSQLASALGKLDPANRLCGAEINTIQEICSNKLKIRNLVFLVSDTEDGRATGQTLQKYFESRSELDIKQIEYRPIEKLQDSDPKAFKTDGLRNLVRAAGEYIQRFGGPDAVAIDATGGYKAQIAIAVLLGQTLSIPVFYRHERFSEIIDFPPMPVCFDYEILGRNSSILHDLEDDGLITSEEMDELDEKLRVMLNEVPDGQTVLYELNPIGQVFLLGFHMTYPARIKLQPRTANADVDFRDDHYPIGFKEHVQKVCDETAYILETWSMSYDKQKSIKGTGFDVRMVEGNQNLIGTYVDRKGFGARFGLRLTDPSLPALTWAANDLNRRYRSK